MTTQFFWILLVLIVAAQVEWPLFVSLATELSDTPPENRQEWLHPVIFEYNLLILHIKLLLF